MIDGLKRFPNYAAAFGLFQGALTQWQSRRPSVEKPTEIRSLKLPGMPHLIHLRNTRSDSAALWQCIVQSQYDFRQFKQAQRVYDTFDAMSKQGDPPVIIDCGSNIGLASVWFAKTFPSACIAAVEPDIDNVDMINKNVAGFGERVCVMRGGVWNEEGHLEITNPKAGSMSFEVALIPEETDESVPAYTIASILKALGKDKANIVKIDIEGAQSALFSSNTEWVGHVDLIIIELEDWIYPWSGSSMSFFKALIQHDFDVLIHGENLFCFRHQDQ